MPSPHPQVKKENGSNCCEAYIWPQWYFIISVELPPIKTENGTGKVFTFDHNDEKEKGEKEQESRLNIEVM